MPEAFLKSITLKLGDDKYEAIVGNASDRGTCTLQPTANPRRITVTDGPNTGKAFPAIYEFAGDTFRVCYELSGKEFPT